MDSKEDERRLSFQKKSKFATEVWIGGAFFYPSENCISLEETLKFRHKDLIAANIAEES